MGVPTPPPLPPPATTPTLAVRPSVRRPRPPPPPFLPRPPCGLRRRRCHRCRSFMRPSRLSPRRTKRCGSRRTDRQADIQTSLSPLSYLSLVGDPFTLNLALFLSLPQKTLSPMQDLSPLVRRGDCIAVQSGTARVAWAGRSKSSHEKSWWRLSPSHCLRGGSRARLWYGHMQSACLSCLLSFFPSILASTSLRPRMPATNRAGDTGYYHSSSCGGSRCCGKGIVCSPHGRREEKGEHTSV